MSCDPKDEYAFEFEKLAAPISQKIFDLTLEDFLRLSQKTI